MSLTWQQQILIGYLQTMLGKGLLYTDKVMFLEDDREMVNRIAWDHGYIMAVEFGKARTPQGVYISATFIKRFWPC
jgi:hypothetical protein